MYSRTRQNNKKSSEFYKQPSDSAQLNPLKSALIPTEEKNAIKKKDKLLSKRKDKEDPSKQLTEKTQAQNSSTEQNHQFKFQESPNNNHPLNKQIEPSNYFEEESPKERFELEKIVRKPHYVKIQQNSILKGFAGHSSVIFKRPILQGTYYFEVKVLKPFEKDQNLAFAPSVRIGICPHDYPHTIPLGGKGSVCYRSIDGNLICDKKSINFGPGFGEGDVIGVELRIGAPHKHPSKQERNEQSNVIFYKNGSKVGQYKNLKQIFYTAGISLFNYAAAQVRIDQNNIQCLPQGCEQYLQNLNKEIGYNDLKSSRIFNQ